MIKSVIVSIICLIILTSFTEVLAQEETSTLLGKNVKEWHAIAIALISENRHEEAIKYYDKILEVNPEDQKALLNKGSVLKDLERYEEAIKYYDKILEVNPDHVKALSNKGISIAFLVDSRGNTCDECWLEAEELIFRAVELEPKNKLAESIMYQFMSGTFLVSERDSIYDISTRITVRDSSGNLISVSEESNSRYLPYPYTDEIFERYVIDEGMMIDGKVYDIAQNVEIFVPVEDTAGAFAISPTKYGHVVDVFFSFIPMIFHEPDDKILVEWTIIKEVT